MFIKCLPRLLVSAVYVVLVGLVICRFTARALPRSSSIQTSPPTKPIAKEEPGNPKATKRRLSEAQIVLLAQRYMADSPRWERDLLYSSSHNAAKGTWIVAVSQIIWPYHQGRIGHRLKPPFEFDDFGELLTPMPPLAGQTDGGGSGKSRATKHPLTEAQIVLLAQRYLANSPDWKKDLLYRSSHDDTKGTWSVLAWRIYPPDREGRFGISLWWFSFEYDDYGKLLDFLVLG